MKHGKRLSYVLIVILVLSIFYIPSQGFASDNKSSSDTFIADLQITYYGYEFQEGSTDAALVESSQYIALDTENDATNVSLTYPFDKEKDVFIMGTDPARNAIKEKVIFDNDGKCTLSITSEAADGTKKQYKLHFVQDIKCNAYLRYNYNDNGESNSAFSSLEFDSDNYYMADIGTTMASDATIEDITLYVIHPDGTNESQAVNLVDGRKATNTFRSTIGGTQKTFTLETVRSMIGIPGTDKMGMYNQGEVDLLSEKEINIAVEPNWDYFETYFQDELKRFNHETFTCEWSIFSDEGAAEIDEEILGIERKNEVVINYLDAGKATISAVVKDGKGNTANPSVDVFVSNVDIEYSWNNYGIGTEITDRDYEYSNWGRIWDNTLGYLEAEAGYQRVVRAVKYDSSKQSTVVNGDSAIEMKIADSSVASITKAKGKDYWIITPVKKGKTTITVTDKNNKYNTVTYDLAVTGHNWGFWKTDSTGETHSRKCKDENCEAIETAKHYMEPWYIMEGPSENHEGTRIRECLTCGYAERQSIPMLKDESTALFSLTGTITGHKGINYKSVKAWLEGLDGAIYQADVSKGTLDNQTGKTAYKYTVSAPEGQYSLVVEAITDKEIMVNRTAVVKLTSKAVNKNINLPNGQAKSEVKSEKGATTALVDGLDALADGFIETNNLPTDAVVQVEFIISEPDAKDKGKEKIHDKAPKNCELQFMDFTIQKTMFYGEGSSVDLGFIADTGERLLSIIIPFDSNGKEVFNIYRYHDGGVDIIGYKPNKDGEYMEVFNDHIIIHAKKFSTYAIGYGEDVTADNDNNNTDADGDSTEQNDDRISSNIGNDSANNNSDNHNTIDENADINVSETGDHIDVKLLFCIMILTLLISIPVIVVKR